MHHNSIRLPLPDNCLTVFNCLSNVQQNRRRSLGAFGCSADFAGGTSNRFQTRLCVLYLMHLTFKNPLITSQSQRIGHRLMHNFFHLALDEIIKPDEQGTPLPGFVLMVLNKALLKLRFVQSLQHLWSLHQSEEYSCL